MIKTRTAFIRLLKFGIIGIIILIIAIFAVSRSVSYVSGPTIWIDEPTDGATIIEKTFLISGKIARASWLNINGRLITVDEQGNFRERLAILPGINHITIDGGDKFGRKITHSITLFGKEQ